MRARLCTGATTLLMLTAHALADGSPERLYAVAPPAVDWSGIYIGAQGGANWTDAGWFFPIDSYYTLPTGKRSYDTDPSGGFFGGHVTINRQSGSLVYGAELALNGSFAKDTRIGPFSSLFPEDEFTTRIKQYGTLTGRLGYARDAWLIYGSAGYAGGRVGLRAISGPPGGGVIAEIDQYLNGWTAGAGVEYMLLPGLSVGLQYDFIRLYGETSSTQTFGVPSNDPFVIQSNDIDLHAISARFSFKLDRPDPAPGSLK